MNPRSKVGIAGMALIVVTNAVAIGGALYNRSSEPESRLMLGERELLAPYRWEWREENSGLSLRLQWRAAMDDERADFYPSYARQARWLDKDKLEALGFDVRYEPSAERASRHYERQLPRDAFIVLEQDGPAYAAALEAARVRLAKAEAEAPKDPDSKRAKETLESAREGLEREQDRNSRLFAVDVGLDLAALREKYRDTSRYAIVRGHIGIGICQGGKLGNQVCGRIEGLEVPTINVPLELRPALEGMEPVRYGKEEERLRFTAEIAFGHRLEPWMVSAERRAPARP